MLRAPALAVGLGALLWALVGCGGSGSASDAVRVEATEYAYEMPDHIEGGLVTMEFVNAGEEVHEWALGRLREGRTEADLRNELRTGKIARLESVDDVGGVPAMTPQATLGLTRELEPGRYVFYCSMPTPFQLAHFQTGMIRGFEVAGTSDAEPPDVDGTITVRDAAIDVPVVEAGTHTLRLVNEADDVRELKLLSLKPGKRAQDLEHWFDDRFRDDPPADMLGVVGRLAPGATAYATISFEAGRRYHLFDGPHRVAARFQVD